MDRWITSLSSFVLAVTLPQLGRAQSDGTAPASESVAPQAQPAAGLTPAPAPATEAPAEPDRAFVPWLARLTFDQSYSVNGFARGAQQTFDPTYQWWFVAEAGYLPDPLTTLYLRQDFVIELTDSNSTTTGQELQLLDTVIEAWRTLLDERPFHPDQQLVLSTRAGFELPASRASQASSIVLGTRARLQAVYVFERLLHGLQTRGFLRYLHRFGGSDTVEADSAFQCVIRNADISTSCTHLGRATVRDVIVASFDGSLQLTKAWSVGALVWLDWAIGQGFEDTLVTGDAIETTTLEDRSTTHTRHRRILDFWVGYRITPWLGARAHLLNTVPERGPAGDLRTPLDPIDTMVGLELSISFDAFYKAAHGYDIKQRNAVRD